jgi:hypothetical protein
MSTVLAGAAIIPSYAKAVDIASLLQRLNANQNGVNEQFNDASTQFLRPITKFIQHTEGKQAIDGVLGASGAAFNIGFSVLQDYQHEAAIAGNEAKDGDYDIDFDTKHKYQSWLKTTYADKKNKNNNADQEHSLHAQGGALVTTSDSLMIGALFTYTNQRIKTDKRNKADGERMGIGFELIAQLLDDVVFQTHLHNSNGSITHKAYFDIDGDAGSKQLMFKGRQKVNRVHFDSNMQYFISVSDTMLVVPAISLNFFRQFSSDYYAFDPEETLANMNAKPMTSINGGINMTTEKLLFENSALLFAGTISAGMGQELYKYSKDYHLLLHKSSGESIATDVAFDKKRGSTFSAGIGAKILSRSKAYELSTAYAYANNKKESAHQGALKLKINF